MEPTTLFDHHNISDLREELKRVAPIVYYPYMARIERIRAAKEIELREKEEEKKIKSGVIEYKNDRIFGRISRNSKS